MTLRSPETRTQPMFRNLQFLGGTMTLVTPFRIGFLPHYAGIRFNGDELLGRLQPASEALHPALVAMSKDLQELAGATVNAVLECEKILVEAGQASPGRPRTPEEYRDWAGRVSRTANTLFGHSLDGGAALVLGHNFGDLVLTLGLAELIEPLLRAEPGHPLLQAQKKSLDDDAAKARSNVALVSRSVGLPEKAQDALDGVAQLATTADLLARRADLEAALTRS